MYSTALRYFLEVVRLGSLNKASEKLHIAPSAISRQIHKLEQEINAPLFERRASGMQLSDAGVMLAEHAKRILLEQERVLFEIEAHISKGGGLIKIASTEGIARSFLAQTMHIFRLHNPAITFDVFVASPKEIISRVREGEVDVGITFSTTPSKGVQIEYAARSPIHVLMRTQHPLSKKKKLALADLEPYPIAVKEAGSTQQQLINLCCQMEGVSLNTVLTSNDSAVLQQFIVHSDAISFSSKVSEIKGQLKSVMLTNPQLHQRDVQVLTMSRRIMPIHIQRFVELIVERMNTDK